MTESISSNVKSGWRKITKPFTPKSRTDKIDDPTSLFSTSKPGPELYVAVARLQEQSGRVAEAERQYGKALREEPNHLKAMLGYAHLLDRMGRSYEAIKMYGQAAKAHPREAAAHNDLGLCYARQGKLNEAAAALDRAVRLQPKRALYRNNLATVLVESGRFDAALLHFAAVHGEAVAHYNLGYLLEKQGDRRAAASQFAAALEKDPSLEAAETWLRRLQRPVTQPDSPSMAAGKNRPGDGLEPRIPKTRLPERRTADRPVRPQRQSAGGGSISPPPLRFPAKKPQSAGRTLSPKLRKLPPLPPSRKPAPRPLEEPPMPQVRPLPPVAPMPGSTR